MSTTIVNTPNPHRGVVVISFLITRMRIFTSKKNSKKDFIEVFGNENGAHLWKKDYLNDFGGFFLNLDNGNQIALLNTYINPKIIDLKFPSIVDWENIGKKYGMDKWEELTEEDVRNVCVGFDELSEWDAYPQDLVWFRKFLLFSCNHSIDDDNYFTNECFGNKDLLFGNVRNWINYYEYMPIANRTELCKKLVSYS